MSEQARFILRAAVLATVLVTIQIAAISQISLLGVAADLTPLLAASTGILAGAPAGAMMGFGVGLLVDLTLFQTLGVSSLVLSCVGYGAGRVRELRDTGNTIVALAVLAGAALAAQLGLAVIEFLLGVDGPVSLLLLRQIAAVSFVDALIALPVFALVRRMLAPALPDDPISRRRRRAYTTGGLSPLERPSGR